MPLQRKSLFGVRWRRDVWTVKRRERRAPASRSHHFNCIVPVIEPKIGKNEDKDDRKLPFSCGPHKIHIDKNCNYVIF
jgi:hypothetical protein